MVFIQLVINIITNKYSLDNDQYSGLTILVLDGSPWTLTFPWIESVIILSTETRVKLGFDIFLIWITKPSFCHASKDTYWSKDKYIDLDVALKIGKIFFSLK